MATTPLPTAPPEPQAPTDRILVDGYDWLRVQQYVIGVSLQDTLPPALGRSARRYQALLQRRGLIQQ